MKSHYCPADKTTISYEGECNWCGEKEKRKIYKEGGIRFQTISQEILALLADKEMSKHELVEATKLSLTTIVSYVSILKERNLIHIANWISKPNTKPTAKYKFGTGIDAEYIGRRKKYLTKGRPRTPAINKTSACDIAASWMMNPKN